MVPDLAYLVAGTHWGFPSHSLAALLWFCLPVTLLLTALFRRISAPLLAHLPLRPAARARLSAVTAPSSPLVITILSAALGTTTHLLLDACTHRRGLGVALWPWLRSVVFHLGERPIPIYSLLQGPGSLLLALLALLCLRALARRHPAVPLPDPTPASRRRFTLVTAIGLTLAVLLPLLAFPAGGLPALVIRLAALVFAALAIAALAAEPLARPCLAPDPVSTFAAGC